MSDYTSGRKRREGVTVSGLMGIEHADKFV